MTYDELLMQADFEGLNVKEKPLSSGDGRIFNNRIAIRQDINTTIGSYTMIKVHKCVLILHIVLYCVL